MNLLHTKFHRLLDITNYIRNDLEVFYKDRDFEFISHFFQLKCVKVN